MDNRSPPAKLFEVLLVAEFFLGFGHGDCTLNYEYIKGVDQTPGVADAQSCELRVHIAGSY